MVEIICVKNHLLFNIKKLNLLSQYFNFIVMYKENFADRHIGLTPEDIKEMCQVVGVNSVEELINQTVPENIRLKPPLNLDEPLSEPEFAAHINELGKKNKLYKSYIGLGYYNTFTPSVIKRNIFENPGWYTAYTPYQAEISQGRLEALLNFQTMVVDLTAMEIANASLLDEATAAAEAMIMAFNSMSRAKKKLGANKFLVADTCLPQTIDVLKTRSEPLGIELVIDKCENFTLTEGVFGLLVQYPDVNGAINDYAELAKNAKENDILVVVAADLLSLTLLTPPGEWGADVVVGTTQRFGIPLGYGGPHAAYFATKEEFKRNIPGRIIGVSKDAKGNRALRMALQTREQHIKRERATSNICTAQVLLAVMAGMYAVYHGPKRLKAIAQNINDLTAQLHASLKSAGFEFVNNTYFDTITFKAENVEAIRGRALGKKINLRYNSNNTISISLDETTILKDIEDLVEIITGERNLSSGNSKGIPAQLERKSDYLTEEVFNKYHTETEMMRYIKRLENKDLSLTHSMISLGSCTMKLNAASELLPLSKEEWMNIHPFVPQEQAQGYLEMINELEKDLAEITGFEAVSLQPNSGAQGEYAGLMTIRAYHKDHGEPHRNITLIPSSAHGTNPASAVMAGMKVVVVKCDEKGNIDVNDLREKAEKYKDNLAALMVTYPSTHGVFEESITEITKIIHDNGGLVYMDGANMNAQVGLTNPANIGADVCHLNLHKTFAIPHGGGGPGVGPIGVNKRLAPYLPSNPLVKTGGEKAITAVSAAPYGSSLVLLISYAYIKMLGEEGLRKSTEAAILSANYMAKRLEEAYGILYTNDKGRVAHEMILECRQFKKVKVEVTDIAKRLMDYGFHAPTVSFPVAGTLMVEPTESESKAELDRFIDAMLQIREEIEQIEMHQLPEENNMLKNAPHTASTLIEQEWNYPYSRKTAVFPLPYVEVAKYWPTVNRVDDAYGDRNLVCTCTPIEEYEEQV